MRKIWLTLSLGITLATSVALGGAQEPLRTDATFVAAPDEQKPPPPPAPPPADAAPASTTRKAPPPPPAAPTPDGRNRKVGPNVKVEVVFSEQRSDSPATPKTVTITTNDGQWGRVRSSVTTLGYGSSPLNVDARPEVLPDGRVLLNVNIEYGEKRVPAGKEVQPGQIIEASLNESVTLLLESGKGLAVTQSADPMSDRRVSVEVKATILKN
jgi:hypothetical protein